MYTLRLRQTFPSLTDSPNHSTTRQDYLDVGVSLDDWGTLETGFTGLRSSWLQSTCSAWANTLHPRWTQSLLQQAEGLGDIPWMRSCHVTPQGKFTIKHKAGGLSNLCLFMNPHPGGDILIVLWIFYGSHEEDSVYFISVQPQLDKYFWVSTMCWHCSWPSVLRLWAKH